MHFFNFYGTEKNNYIEYPRPPLPPNLYNLRPFFSIQILIKKVLKN